jgi:hypothetical protein
MGKGFLAIDPGGKRTGWAYFSPTGEPISDGIVDTENSYKALRNMLDNMDPETIIIEEFRVFPWKSNAQRWSVMKQVKVAGAVEMWAEVKEVEVIQQPSTALGMGFRYQGLTMPSHPKDNLSARAHGVYYLTQRGMIQ